MTPSLLLVLLLAASAPARVTPPAAPAAPAPPSAPAEAESDGGDGAGSPAKDAGTVAGEASRRTGDWPAQASGKTVTLDGKTTVDAALEKIAAAGGWNLVASTGTDGARPLKLRLRKVPVEEALEAVLQGTSLVASRRGTIVTVAPGAPGARAAAPAVAKTAKQLRKEARKEARDRAREAKRAARAERGSKGDRVAHGDQVVKAGEAADDVVVLGGSVRLEPGATAQEVVAVVGSVELGTGTNVDGDVVAVGGDVHLMPGAHVGGDTVSVGGRVIVDVGATVDGEQTSVDVPGLAQVLSIVGARSWTPHASRALSFASMIARFAVFFALALLLSSIAPRRLESLTAGLSNAPLKTAVTGLLGTLALPIAAILLAVTVIGIPLIAVLVLAVLVAVLMGYSALALFIGRALPLRVERARTVLQLALGTAIIILLGQIPVLGWMVWITGWLFVMGVVIRTRFGRPPVPPAPVYGTTAPPPIPPVEPPIPPAPRAPPIPPPEGGVG